MTFLLVLQYLGAGLCILAQLQRSLSTNLMLASFITSSIAAILLTVYYFLTVQYALIAVEVVFIITNIKGYILWRTKTQ
jgi:hypothetical protein